MYIFASFFCMLLTCFCVFYLELHKQSKPNTQQPGSCFYDSFCVGFGLTPPHAVGFHTGLH